MQVSSAPLAREQSTVVECGPDYKAGVERAEGGMGMQKTLTVTNVQEMSTGNQGWPAMR